MKSENKAKAGALAALAANFGKEFPECLLPIWLDLLSPYPAEHVARAVRLVIQEYEYKTLPPFAVLQKALDRLQGNAGADGRAAAEWVELLKAVEARGYSHGQPDDLCPETAHALRLLGGWERACLWREGELAFRRREFLELWKAAHEREGFAGLLPGMGKALPERQVELCR